MKRRAERRRSCPSLQRLAEEALIRGGGVGPGNVFKCLGMALRQHYVRLVRYCCRYILLNHRAMIPLALKSLSKDELQQVDFYHRVWSVDPFAPLGDARRRDAVSRRYPSHLHPGWLAYHVRQQSLFARLRRDRKGLGGRGPLGLGGDVDVKGSPKLQGAGGGGDLFEVATGEDGRKHYRVLLRVKRRYKELRKRLKQIAALEARAGSQPLEPEQRARLGNKEAFSRELKGMKKALRGHRAGKEFLAKLGEIEPGSGSKRTPRSGSGGRGHPPHRAGKKFSGASPKILSWGTPVKGPQLSPSFDSGGGAPKVSPACRDPPPLDLGGGAHGSARAAAATTAPPESPPSAHSPGGGGGGGSSAWGGVGNAKKRLSPQLSAFESIQREQLREDEAVRRRSRQPQQSQQPGNANTSTNQKPGNTNTNPWKVPSKRRTFRGSPRGSPAGSSPPSGGRREAMPELSLSSGASPFALPKQALGHAAAVVGPRVTTQSRSLLEGGKGGWGRQSGQGFTVELVTAIQPNPKKIFSVLSTPVGGSDVGAAGGETPPKSFLQIQQEQRRVVGTAAALAPRVTTTKGASPRPHAPGGFDQADAYAPPPLQLGVIVTKKSSKKKKKRLQQQQQQGGGIPFSWGGAKGKAWGKEAQPPRNNSAGEKELKQMNGGNAGGAKSSKSFSEIMREQEKLMQLPAAKTEPIPKASAWLRKPSTQAVHAEIQSLERIQTQQLVEELSEQKRPKRRRRRQNRPKDKDGTKHPKPKKGPKGKMAKNDRNGGPSVEVETDTNKSAGRGSGRGKNKNRRRWRPRQSPQQPTDTKFHCAPRPRASHQIRIATVNTS